MDQHQTKQLTNTLTTQIPKTLTELTNNLPNTTTPGNGTRNTTRAHPLPYRENVSEARIQLETVLVGWAKLTAEQTKTHNPQPNPTAAAHYLARHLPWILEQEFAQDLADEITTAHNRARQTLTDNPPTLTIGTCPSTLTTGETCTGVLMVGTQSQAITCPRCATTWPAKEWPRLGVLLGCEPVGLVDAYAASRRLHDLGYPVTPDLIRKWAERGKVTRKGKGPRRRTLYELADLLSQAQASA